MEYFCLFLLQLLYYCLAVIIVQVFHSHHWLNLHQNLHQNFIFDAVVNVIVFLIFLSGDSLLEYRNATYFCIFILYPATLPNSFVLIIFSSLCTQSCLTLCDPMDCSLPGFYFFNMVYHTDLSILNHPCISGINPT